MQGLYDTEALLNRIGLGSPSPCLVAGPSHEGGPGLHRTGERQASSLVGSLTFCRAALMPGVHW